MRPTKNDRKPEDRWAELIAKEDGFIQGYGFFHHLVFGDEDNPGFIYTTGLSEKGKPDMIFVGSSRPNSAGYLREIIAHMLAGGEIQPGRIEPETDLNPYRVPMFVLDATAKLETHAYGVHRRLRRVGSTMPARLMQVVMPDLDGRFPWDDGYDWADQRIGPEQIASPPVRPH